MPATTTLASTAHSALAAPARTTAPYENWRPPITAVSLLVPVGAHALVVASLLGDIMMPTGTVHAGQTPQQAAQQVLQSPTNRLPLLRLVALARVQMRRRKVTTHVLATEPISRKDARRLTYRDPRAGVRVLPTMQVIDELAPQGRLRALAGLQALATGETAYIDGEAVRATVPPELLLQR